MTKIKKRKTRNDFEDGLDKQLKRSGVRYKYEARKIPYYWTGHYTPDWDVTNHLGEVFIIEAKGFFRVQDRRKLVAVKRCNPHLDIRLVFYRSVPAYIRWCEKYNFKYAIGSIPKEWLHGGLL